jgi:hypothetical protein
LDRNTHTAGQTGSQCKTQPENDDQKRQHRSWQLRNQFRRATHVRLDLRGMAVEVIGGKLGSQARYEVIVVDVMVGRGGFVMIVVVSHMEMQTANPRPQKRQAKDQYC